ncbi:MAG: DUF1343 domain-containing protein [Bacteroidota bacterium]|nr:DUF1343 domain-containing protein [Bacteroidota bacterium]
MNENAYSISINQIEKVKNKTDIITGADRLSKYLPLLRGKRVGMTINQTSRIGDKLSMDSLLNRGIQVVKIFGPEHGFRGDESDGAKVGNFKDEKTGIPVISLYGDHNKPTKEDLNGVDIMIFDIQDVGARFYTFISTLHYIMEACAENNIELIVLDRPNPNDGYVDGPILEEKFKSFVGMHPVPIVHGMTIGEYAQMINGEGWLANRVKCKLKVIEIQNYSHGKPYTLPIAPSPNLNSQQSILLYPSLCLFEGTVISQGRGTYFPFQVLGNPELKEKYSFSFKPVSIKGMSDNPPLMNKVCYGLDLRNYDTRKLKETGRLNLTWLIEFYNAYPYKDKFFIKSANGKYAIDRLAGTDKLREQIVEAKTEKEIRESWEPGLSHYKTMRKKYLLYP